MTRRKLSLVLALAGAVAACDSPTVSAPDSHDEVVGSWISAGTDMAPGVVSTLKPRRVEVTFEPSHTYAVIVTDSAYVVSVFSGTWTASGAEGTVRAITLQQGSPVVATSSGIFQVTDNTLTFEVIEDSVVSAGVTPPTVAGGFGSTSHAGVALGTVWTQQFLRQDTQVTSLPCNPSEPTATSKRPCEAGWSGLVPKGWK